MADIGGGYGNWLFNVILLTCSKSQPDGNSIESKHVAARIPYKVVFDVSLFTSDNVRSIWIRSEIEISGSLIHARSYTKFTFISYAYKNSLIQYLRLKSINNNSLMWPNRSSHLSRTRLDVPSTCCCRKKKTNQEVYRASKFMRCRILILWQYTCMWRV